MLTHVIGYFLVGSFCIAHQSPPNVYMREGESIALYCVASNHTLLHTYRWENSSGQLSVLSPVLWVNKIDTYKCTVRESANSCECHSSNICVQGLYMYMYYMLCDIRGVVMDGRGIQLHETHIKFLPHLSGIDCESPDCKITRIDPPTSHSSVQETCCESFVQGMLL